MLAARTRLSLGLILLGACCALAPARAEILTYEVNNTLATAYVLPIGQRVVLDSLNGNVGRPDTILGQFDPAFSQLQVDGGGQPRLNDNYPGVGNGFGSKLVGVPLRANGSAYFSISGSPDGGFDGSHTQDGKYRVTYQVFAPGAGINDAPIKTVSETEFVTPGFWDNVWLDPDNSKPDWTGYTVNVTVDNIVGPGTGDSLDYFVFRGFQPFEPFSAQVTDAQFSALIALFDPLTNAFIKSSVGGAPVLTGVADQFGRVKIGVSGLGDNNFLGEHFQVGDYKLSMLSLVPEPSTLALLTVGAAVLGLRVLRHGRRRRA